MSIGIHSHHSLLSLGILQNSMTGWVNRLICAVVWELLVSEFHSSLSFVSVKQIVQILFVAALPFLYSRFSYYSARAVEQNKTKMRQGIYIHVSVHLNDSSVSRHDMAGPLINAIAIRFMSPRLPERGTVGSHMKNII